MPMNPKLLRPRSTIHPEAADWANRVRTNGGSVSGTTLSAVSKFCASIASAGIRDRFFRLNLFCGDQLSAALVPLYTAESVSSAIRGNATDTNINFVSGDYFNTGPSSGLQGDGATKYLVTGLPGNSLNANNAHLGFGLRAADTSSQSSRTVIGVYSGDMNSFEVIANATDAARPAACFTRFSTPGDSFGDEVGAGGPLAAGDIVASWPTMYRNGAATGPNATSYEDFPNDNPFTVFATGLGGDSATVQSDCRTSWYSIGLAMTASEVMLFYTAIASFNATMSRA
jgi:hypothetical protein